MYKKLHKIDLLLLTQIQQLPKSARPVMIAATIMGQPAVLFVLLIIFMGYMYVLKEYTLIKVGGIAAGLLFVSPMFKLLFQRARPDQLIYATYKQPSSYSFPSGHAYCTALVFGLFAYLAITRLSSPYSILVPVNLLVLTIVIGISRIYLGSHYPSDVVAGWILGLVVLFLLIKLSGI